MKPNKIDFDGVPVFTTRDIDDYGFPELYGYEIYRVVESRDLNIGSDFVLEQQRDWKPIHRYSRLARFKATLLNILGERGKLPTHVLLMIKTYLKPDAQDKWNAVRALLKHFKMRRYYDQIPTILKTVLNVRCFAPLNSEQIQSLYRDFQALSDRFERNKQKHQRKYFPNIRFIVLKLLELHGIDPILKIPKARTNRKLKSLDSLWNLLINQV